MDNFWKNCKEDVQKLLILFIIFIVTTYGNSLYNKLLCQISSFSGEKYVESLIQHHPC